MKKFFEIWSMCQFAGIAAVALAGYELSLGAVAVVSVCTAAAAAAVTRGVS